jgi:hypothetical protein
MSRSGMGIEALSKISGSNGGELNYGFFLGSCKVWTGTTSPTIQKFLLSPSSKQ